ncbi:acyl-CoA thioesterase [Oricola sp.]|uniref:acyl-CoA thioesterase n=1 Tax=Oricola sp. TaxID=1979950 RepID=UPI003BA90DA5
MHFSLRQKVLFKHCDPAGIVFYPRYFEMINDTVETMFSDLLGWPFETMHPEGGVPTASFDVDFRAPSRHGDVLEWQVTIVGIGGTSMTLQLVARAQAETRLTATQVLVCIGADGRSKPWPANVREKVTKLLEGTS